MTGLGFSLPAYCTLRTSRELAMPSAWNGRVPITMHTDLCLLANTVSIAKPLLEGSDYIQ